MTDVTFALNAAFDRQLFWEAGSSVRYLVARVKASRHETGQKTERSPLNIALVIDASGSMGGGKIVAAKQAAIGLAERLREQDRLTLVSFASDVIVHCDAFAMNAENLDRVRDEIARLTTRGMTDLSSGWFAGVESTARVFEANPRLTPRIIILSDGHTNEGITNLHDLSEHAGELLKRGVLTSTLGIGDGYDEQLLRGIAENGGGRLHDAEETEEIGSVLLGELDDIYGNVLEDTRIILKAPHDVMIEPLGKGQYERQGAHWSLKLGAVQDAIERVTIFKVTCPTTRCGQELAFEVTASGRSADDMRIIDAAPAQCTLIAAPEAANTAQQRDDALATLIVRVWSAQIVATGARMNREGDYRAAEAYVERELRYFSRYAEGLPQARAMLKEIELLSQRVGQEFSSRMRKEMVFQSTLTMESRSDRRGSDKAAWSARMRRGD